MWQIAQPLLFGLIGAELDIAFISPSLVGKAIIICIDNLRICNLYRSGFCTADMRIGVTYAIIFNCVNSKWLFLERENIRCYCLDTEGHCSGLYVRNVIID